MTTTDGDGYCWGRNEEGQIDHENPSSNDLYNPFLLPSLPSAKRRAVAAGGAMEHGNTCELRSDGRIWCWGGNSHGQSGLRALGTLIAAPLELQSSTLWTDVVGGDRFHCAIDNRSKVHCWGRKFSMTDTTGLYTEPSEAISEESFAFITTLNRHTCGIDVDKGLWCWGQTTNGKLGHRGTGEAPDRVGSTGWLKVATGAEQTCGTRGAVEEEGGTLWCWGSNANGELGDNSLGTQADMPMQIGIESDWTHIAAGNQVSCGIRNAELYCWGTNTTGRLGLGLPLGEVVPTPTQITATDPQQVEELEWTGVWAGAGPVCARTKDLRLWCWGQNGEGQLGIGMSGNADVPTLIRFP
jgi:alpha-tubulin suppressor-like RCC1 family protein